jgi:hypothetical protein
MYELLTTFSDEMVLVMEHVEGELLSDVFKRALFSVEDALGLGIGVLSGATPRGLASLAIWRSWITSPHLAREVRRDLVSG